MCDSMKKYIHVLTAWPKKKRTILGMEIEVLLVLLSLKFYSSYWLAERDWNLLFQTKLTICLHYLYYSLYKEGRNCWKQD